MTALDNTKPGDPGARRKQYTFHSLSEMFPRMSEQEFKALVEDIHLNGLRQPIVVYQGQILDGRHRYDAANEAKRELTDKDFTDFKGDDPLKFVVSQNIHRRHLNESQRAIIAAQIANLKKGANQHTTEGGSIDLSSASKMLNVGEASVKRARKVLEKAAPAIVEQIKQGKVRVSAVGKKVLAKPKEEQVKALEAEQATRQANNNVTINASEAYDKAQKKLIEKLQALAPEVAEASSTETIKLLKNTVATMLKAAASVASKAA